MKKNKIQLFSFAAVAIMLFASCAKESENIFNMFDVEVTFHGTDPKSVVDYKLVNDNEVVVLDYTVTSGKEDMYTIVIEGFLGASGSSVNTIKTIVLTDANRRSFSGKETLTMNRDGKTSYRILAKNSKGNFIGDGYKKVTVDVNPSYMIYANRRVYFPDTVNKVMPAFFSLRDVKSYSYTDGKANAANIDFGIYAIYVPAVGTTAARYVYNLYSLSASPAPFNTIYDVSTWDKRATKFARVTGQTSAFIYNATSGSTIETLAKARNPNVLATNPTNATTASLSLLAGDGIYFLTPEGKYGIMHINTITSDYDKKPYMDVSVKIQK